MPDEIRFESDAIGLLKPQEVGPVSGSLRLENELEAERPAILEAPGPISGSYFLR
jgi:hypothetical protein